MLEKTNIRPYNSKGFVVDIPAPTTAIGEFARWSTLSMERILNHRDVKGQRTSYLVLWRGYPPTHDSWEPRAKLVIDCEGLVH